MTFDFEADESYDPSLPGGEAAAVRLATRKLLAMQFAVAIAYAAESHEEASVYEPDVKTSEDQLNEREKMLMPFAERFVDSLAAMVREESAPGLF